MIPKIIHYAWFTDQKNHRLPTEVRRSLLSWKKYYPDWEIKLWNFSNFNSETSNICKLAKTNGRLEILNEYLKIWSIHNYGGVFIKPGIEIDDNLNLEQYLNNKFFLGLNNGSLDWNIIGCEKRNYFSLELLNTLNQLINIEDVDSILTDFVINKYNPDLSDSNIQNLSRLTIYPEIRYHGKSYFSNDDELVSVVMPVWNGEVFIKDAISSVLNQTYKNLELVIVDDGSTDSTKDIINSFSDSRIRYIYKEHSGISNSLNLGIEKSRGDFIARMDSDDIMYPNRLNIQIKYLNLHPEVDILGTGFEWGNGKQIKEYYKPKTGKVTIDELINEGNKLGHPTVIFRKRSLQKIFQDGVIYESYYNGAEDYKLWITSLQKGLEIHNISEPTIYYRQHENQEANKNKSWEKHDWIKNAYTRKNNTTTEMTVIIPFKNEGIEIEKTVASVRATSCCNIILINDFSNDGYNYKDIADRFGCEYLESNYPLGVAGGRDLGVSKIKTPYFVLLDGHMRFYDSDWELRVIKHLKENPESIITSNSSIFTKESGQPYKNEDGIEINKISGSKAAVVNFKEPGWEFSGKWTQTTDILNLPDELSMCSCVMGAFYASSKEWWNKIGGLQGLVGWGYDEPLMSIKTYLAGGKCFILRDFYVGHLYRGKSPYISYSAGIDSNQIYLINLFSPNPEKLEENLKERIGENRYKQAKQTFLNRYDEFEKFKNHFYKNVSKLSWDEFLEINDKFY